MSIYKNDLLGVKLLAINIHSSFNKKNVITKLQKYSSGFR